MVNRLIVAIGAVFLLVSCAPTGASQAYRSQRTVVSGDKSCSKKCPACPACPEAQKAKDWYCFDYVRDKTDRSNICSYTAGVCERVRKSDRIVKSGARTDACKPAKKAYCFFHVVRNTTATQPFCSKTLAECRKQHKVLKTLIIEGKERLSECEDTKNVDSVFFVPDEV